VLSEWEDGWRVSIVDKEKPFIKALSKMGKMYLTKRFDDDQFFAEFLIHVEQVKD